jgi:hypothetical protein
MSGLPLSPQLPPTRRVAWKTPPIKERQLPVRVPLKIPAAVQAPAQVPAQAPVRVPAQAPVRVPAQAPVRVPLKVPLTVSAPTVKTEVIAGYRFQPQGMGVPYECVDSRPCSANSYEAAERLRAKREYQWLQAQGAHLLTAPNGVTVIQDAKGRCYTYDFLLDRVECPSTLLEEWNY